MAQMEDPPDGLRNLENHVKATLSSHAINSSFDLVMSRAESYDGHIAGHHMGVCTICAAG